MSGRVATDLLFIALSVFGLGAAVAHGETDAVFVWLFALSLALRSLLASVGDGA